MDIRKSERHDTVILEIRGEIEVFSLPTLQKKAESCLGGADQVILDLKELTYIDSAGLGFLVNFNDRLQTRDQHLSLSNLQAHVEKTFRIMHLDKILDIRKSNEVLLG
jgi:anti-sigma B factor antagonist